MKSHANKQYHVVAQWVKDRTDDTDVTGPITILELNYTYDTKDCKPPRLMQATCLTQCAKRIGSFLPLCSTADNSIGYQSNDSRLL